MSGINISQAPTLEPGKEVCMTPPKLRRCDAMPSTFSIDKIIEDSKIVSNGKGGVTVEIPDYFNSMAKSSRDQITILIGKIADSGALNK